MNPSNLIERLELLILETKAGHDGFYVEMLNISEQLLSMNIINKEQLDNFVLIMVNRWNHDYVNQWSCFADKRSYDYVHNEEKSTIKTKQQLLAREVFSTQITKLRRERIIPLYKDETFSADLIDKSSLNNYSNNLKFILTVIYIFTKCEWAIPFKNKSGLSITNGFKAILSEGRKPEKLCVDRSSEFYNKTFKSLLKEYETETYSTYSDLKAVFIERFNRTILHIIKNQGSSLLMVIG